MNDRAGGSREPDTQSEVIAFLSQAANWPGRPASVDRIDTHAAIVFLAGDEVLKLRRSIRFPYLDFTTLQARRRYAEYELALNERNAPGIYLGVVAVTRDPKGRLQLQGAGEPVEWLVRMRRFNEADILSRVAARGELTRKLAVELGDVVARYHAAAPIAAAPEDAIESVASQVVSALSKADDPRIIAAADALDTLLQRQLRRTSALRKSRAVSGRVRRCHGDLHLNNIVLWHGHPAPFDALEFDERLATIDVLYDLAFLLMDLERAHARSAGNALLARYLWRANGEIDIEGLAALPLFLGLRAGVRAMVALDRDRVAGQSRNNETLISHVEDTLALANRCLDPPAPRLIAIGGLSGTGKTALAEALAPRFGAVPGAWHLRTDLERKRMLGVEELDRLPASSYTPELARQVYDRVCRLALTALAGGHSVIIDAVLARPHERREIREVATKAGARFDALWLQAPPNLLQQRVEARKGDASDATPEVVALQAGFDLGPIDWPRIDASGDRDGVAAEAAVRLHVQ